MKLSEFKSLLRQNPEAKLQLVLPSRDTIPVSFHITEVAHVQKRFIDCGGKRHTTETCQLQVWEGEDSDHRLFAGKMAHVLDLATSVLPEGQDLDIEIEYETESISQYPVTSCTVSDDAVTFSLALKHTDCLAKELCGPPAAKLRMAPQSEASCCGSGAGASCCP